MAGVREGMAFLVNGAAAETETSRLEIGLDAGEPRVSEQSGGLAKNILPSWSTGYPLNKNAFCEHVSVTTKPAPLCQCGGKIARTPPHVRQQIPGPIDKWRQIHQ
jgi:hypothetical protein